MAMNTLIMYDLNALTGLLTPPGISVSAMRIASCDFS
jgi:hypothetical protein